MNDHIRSEQSRKRAKVKPIVFVALIAKRRLGLYGHIRRREPEDITRMVLDKGKRPRGKPRIRWMDNIMIDMNTYGLDDQMMEDRKVWSKMVATVDTC